MKRKQQQQQKLNCRWKRKFFLALLLSFCFASLVVMQLQYSRITSTNLVQQQPKIAFLFIARNRLPLDVVWDAFFKLDAFGRDISVSTSSFFVREDSPTSVVWAPKAEYKRTWVTPHIANWFCDGTPGSIFFNTYFSEIHSGDKEQRFSIYIHSRPGFLFNKGTTKSAYFYDRQISDSIQVDWGEATMILAERILLNSSLKDADNRRFVFLSDSCIPLYNFSYTYDYIMSTPTSFVDSFADTKDGRYNPKMDPIVPVHNWRKGSQWAVLTRKHAKVVLRDNAVLPIFQRHCQRKSLPEFWRERHIPADTSKEHNCIPDEHYVQTLLAQEGLEGEITRRTLTHTAWDVPTSRATRERERRGWHPTTYRLSDATPKVIQAIKDIDNVYYETEYRREWCTSKGKPSRCFLFARKFTRPAAIQLLNMSVLGASDRGR